MKYNNNANNNILCFSNISYIIININILLSTYNFVSNVVFMELNGTTKKIMEQLLSNNKTKDIAEKLNIHIKSVDKYIRVLRDLGLVTTKKGRNGGIYLTNEGRYLLEKNKISLINTKVQIIAKDRIGLLADISLNISNLGGNILSTTLEKENNNIILWLTIENLSVSEINKLKNILNNDIIKLVIV